MPWYEHDAVVEGIAEEFGGDTDDAGDIDLSTDAGLVAAGFTVREAGG